MENKKRILIIDQIRGFAMFGVLLVNLTMMENPFQMNAVATTGTINVFFEKLIDFFAVGKFYSMFAILFGLGFYLFMENKDDEIHFFKKRLKILFVIGLLHLIFGWSGDILHVYAIGGFFLISKRKQSVQVLIKRSMILFLFSVILISVLLMVSTGTEPSVVPTLSTFDETQYFSVVSNRIINEFPIVFSNLFIVLPRIISLFYLGYAIGKMRILSNIQDHLPLIKKVFKSAGASFLLLIIIRIAFTNVYLINILAKELSTLLGAMTYGTGLTLMAANQKMSKVLSLLSAAGKMALTNYLVQTLFWTTLLYGYGADLGGKIPYAMFLPLALLFYGFQIIVCNLWMHRFKQGPMETVWRYFTYRLPVKNQ
jgi:uncharacterized protein